MCKHSDEQYVSVIEKQDRSIIDIKEDYHGGNYVPLPERINPVDAWAFIRVKDEMRTLPACLNSIVSVIKKGVIAYNPSDDLSEEKFILEFCEKHNGFIPFKYDYDVIPAGNREYLTNTDKNRQLDTYYNAAFALIPNGEWFIKIDADHVYDTEKLARLLSLPKENEIVSISRLNLDVVDGALFLLCFPTAPYADPQDHWLMRKFPEMHFELYVKYVLEGKEEYFCAYEILRLNTVMEKYQLRMVHTDLVNWHFPYLKDARRDIDRKVVPLEDYADVLEHKMSISAEMFDSRYVKKYLAKAGMKEFQQGWLKRLMAKFMV